MEQSAEITISDGIVSALVHPALGAGLGRFDYVADGRCDPLFRPQPPTGVKTPFELASIVLVPWSNRISSGGFRFEGHWHRLEPNVAGTPFPLHGNAFSLPWQVVNRTQTSVVLRLQSNGPGPFRYEAHLTYAISDGALSMAMDVRNMGPVPLPFGAGFHPWLPRSVETTLRAKAAAVWLEDEQHLRAGSTPDPIPDEWNFSQPRLLPPRFINNGFAAWDGSALVAWPDRGLRLRIDASPNLDTYIVYSPSAESEFFCFEPVTHPVDAINLPVELERTGLKRLEPNQSLFVKTQFCAETYLG